MMRRNKAIRILEEQKIKLQNNQSYSWTLETCSYIKAFFGEKSDQAEFFKYYNWDWNFNVPSIGAGENYTTKEGQISETQKYLDACIFTLQNIGIYKSPTQNLLTRIPDWAITIIVPSLFIGGTLFGKYLSDVQNIELKNKNEELKFQVDRTFNKYKMVVKMLYEGHPDFKGRDFPNYITRDSLESQSTSKHIND